MRFAHRPACRGQRCALPTAPTFAHKLHSLPPLFLFLQFKETRFKEDALTDKVVSVEPDGTGTTPTATFDTDKDQRKGSGGGPA